MYGNANIDLTNATHTYVNNVAAGTEVVSAAANTKGVIIKWLFAGLTAATTWTIEIGGVVFAKGRGDADGSDAIFTAQNIFVPAGKNIKLYSQDTFADVVMYHEVL